MEIVGSFITSPSLLARHQNSSLSKFVNVYLVQILNGNLAFFTFLQTRTSKGLFFLVSYLKLLSQEQSL